MNVRKVSQERKASRAQNRKRNGSASETERLRKMWDEHPYPRLRRKTKSLKNDPISLLEELDERLGWQFKCIGDSLHILRILGFKNSPWSRLSKFPERIHHEDQLMSDYDLAVAYMAPLIEDKRWPLKRAAETAAAALGVDRHASWVTAVDNCEAAWRHRGDRRRRDYIDRSARSKKLKIANAGITYERLSDGTVMYFGDTMTVNDDPFWREAIERGLITEFKVGE